MAELTFKTINAWTIARFEGATLSDSQTIERASDELARRIAMLPLRAMLVINFRSVEFVSSQVIGLLLRANTLMSEKGGTLKLCHVSPKIREALHITGLLDKFTIARNEESVVGSRKREKAMASPEDVGWLD